MRIFVKVRPAAKEEKIYKLDETHLRISVKEPPIEGRANTAVVKALAVYFKVSSDNVRIISGYYARDKVIEIS